MSDLTKAITEALDQAERLARDCGAPKRWKAWADKQGLRGIVDVFAVHHRTNGIYGIQPSREVEAFLVANDPASVLRSVAAWRDILKIHSPGPNLNPGWLCGTCHPIRRGPCATQLAAAAAWGVTRKDSTDE